MTRNARNRFVAWLGIAAMWLAIVAPVISQSIAAHNAALDPQAALCDVEALPDAHAHHHDDAGTEANVHADADEHAGSHSAGGHFDACSYCGLLAHHLPVVLAISHAAASVERVSRVAPVASDDVVVAKSFNAASARAPPVLS